MISDRVLVPAPAARAAADTGRRAIAAELLARVRAELPVVASVGERGQLLAAT